MSRPISLTARLTVLFVLVSTGVLLGLAWVIVGAIEQHFVEEDKDVLEGKILLVRNMLEQTHSNGNVADLRDRLQGAFVGHPDLAMNIVTSGGEVLLATSDRPFPQSPIRRANLTDAPMLIEWRDGEQQYRGLAAVIPVTAKKAGGTVIAVATDIGHHEKFIARFRRTLTLYVAVAALLSGVLGSVAVRRGLTPVRIVTAQAATMTARRLDYRLPADAIPAELSDLVDEFNRMLERLEDAFARLSDFSADLAHELRTPISNLMTQTEVALSRKRNPAVYRDILTSNLEEFTRLAHIISDILFLAKADRGLILPSRERIFLEQEIRSLFEFYEAFAEQRGITLESTGGGELDGDRLMLRRALNNLLSNALRHAPDASVVAVRTVRVTGGLMVMVENSGEAIPEANLARVFDRFYRADVSRSHGSRDGAGLGLAITRSIVAAHGGTVAAESRGGINRFILRFP